jgi:DNA polymerase-3 subunit gamma/tau
LDLLHKHLEAPPPNIAFVLSTTEFDRVPESIVSRCQPFLLTAVTDAEMVRHLKSIAKKEGVSLETARLVEIAGRAQGRLRDALNLLERAIAEEEARP